MTRWNKLPKEYEGRVVSRTPVKARAGAATTKAKAGSPTKTKPDLPKARTRPAEPGEIWSIMWADPWLEIPTANEMMRSNWKAIHAHSKTWKEQFYSLAILESRAKPLPYFEKASLHVVHHRNSRGRIDVGAVYFAGKAALDGLVAAGLVYDDDHKFIRPITYDVVIDGVNGVELTFTDLSQ